MITRPLRDRSRERFPSSGTESTRPDWLLRATVLAALLSLVWVNRGFIKPLAMAGLFAATLYPVFLRLESRIPRASVRAALLTGLFAITFIVPIGIVAFLAADAGLKKFQGLPSNWTDALELDLWVGRLSAFVPFSKEEILHVVQQGGAAIGKSSLALLQSLVSDLPKLTVDNTVIVLGLFVFLADAHRIIPWLVRLAPLGRKNTLALFEAVGALASSVVLASVASGLVQSALIGLACVVLGTPGALLITMTAFVLSFIPVVGTVPVSLYLIGAAALQGDWTRTMGFLIAAVAAGLSDNVVRPYVLSGSSRLHPLVGFIAAFGALESIGFYGLFLGPVLAGAVFTLVELVLSRESA